MVRISDNNELGDTKPHRLPEHENQTQPAKRNNTAASQDSISNTNVTPSAWSDVIPASPDRPLSQQTQPIFSDAAEENLMLLSSTLAENPQQPQVRRQLYETLQRYLTWNPFLRYLKETDSHYQVITGSGRVVTVPKDRTPIPPYPVPSLTALQHAHRWLGYALIGLLLAGLGALICSPIAGIFAWRASFGLQDKDQRRRAVLALIYAGALWAIGSVFSLLFLLHILPG